MQGMSKEISIKKFKSLIYTHISIYKTDELYENGNIDPNIDTTFCGLTLIEDDDPSSVWSETLENDALDIGLATQINRTFCKSCLEKLS